VNRAPSRRLFSPQPEAPLARAASSASGWGLKGLQYGDRFAGYFYMDHIRFGPKNTNDRR